MTRTKGAIMKEPTLTQSLSALPLTTSTDLGRHSTLAKRAASELRRLLGSVGSALPKKDHEALTNATRVLDNIGSAAALAKRLKVNVEADKKRRENAALKALQQAFADVTDPAGLVAMLATGGSWRMHVKTPHRELDAYAARTIMRDERSEALDYYAYCLAADSKGDLAAEATALRAKFDSLRQGLEVKHAVFIARLKQTLDQIQSNQQKEGAGA